MRLTSPAPSVPSRSAPCMEPRAEASGVKPVLAILGVGMIILGLIGLGSVAWLGWVDFGLGCLALVEASLLRPESRTLTIVSEAVIGLGCLAMWIIGLAVHSAAWLVWWTFAFGIAFLLVAAAPGPPVVGPEGRP